MKILNSIKQALEPKKIEDLKRCPKCKNNSLLPWTMRAHGGTEITENPDKYVVGLRCEKCPYNVIYKPMLVFAAHTYIKSNDAEINPNIDEDMSDMLTKAIERCVIDHRKDCIPQDAWNVVAPRIKKKLAHVRAKECVTPPLNTPQYWESSHWTVICYEAHGMCVWGFD
jgi:predicted nucleic-acid-binding Zn-ribbon protein